MNSKYLTRKGARKVQEVPSDVLSLLHKGELETVNLTEWLAIQHKTLIQFVFPKLGITQKNIDVVLETLESQKNPSAMSTTKLVGSTLYRLYYQTKNFEEILSQLTNHPSDAIRCYAPYLISINGKLNLEQKLNQSQTLVSDRHFGVREVVWMALRSEIELHLEEAIKILTSWSNNENENIRRFATESTRPRGVWCKHIDRLKEHPEMALPILERLKSDDSKYVQDSVGNWLNDASKSKPDFVINLCDLWKSNSPTKNTEKIIKRARRTLDKK